MDSPESRTHGGRACSAGNGYLGRSCHHPVFVFNLHLDLERAMLGRGDDNSANIWRQVLLPVIEPYRDRPYPCGRGAVATRE